MVADRFADQADRLAPIVVGDVGLAAGSRSARPPRRGTGSRTWTSAGCRPGSGSKTIDWTKAVLASRPTREARRRRAVREAQARLPRTLEGLLQTRPYRPPGSAGSAREPAWRISSFARAAASLRNVAGPKTTRVAPSSPIRAQTSAAYGPSAAALPGQATLEREQLADLLGRARAVRDRPRRGRRSRRRRSARGTPRVPSNAAEPLSTSLSVPASGESRSAPTTPTIATIEIDSGDRRRRVGHGPLPYAPKQLAHQRWRLGAFGGGFVSCAGRGAGLLRSGAVIDGHQRGRTGTGTFGLNGRLTCPHRCSVCSCPRIARLTPSGGPGGLDRSCPPSLGSTRRRQHSSSRGAGHRLVGDRS